MTKPPLCPCQSGRSFLRCCGPFLQGESLPGTAEQLMRSRYTAYVQHDAPYLLATWHPDTRPASLTFDETPPPKWFDLTIRSHVIRSPHEAEVEFIARYRIDGRGHRLHETSRFVREDGRWFYLAGDIKA